MILRIPGVLNREAVAALRERLVQAPWTDGAATAGEQSALAKRNLQVPEAAPEAKALGERVLRALAACPTFMSAALPAKVYPPLFNRYGVGMGFRDHIDNAVRVSGDGARYRTDVSATLFLSNPKDYAGGELSISGQSEGWKLPAGDLLLYPATTVHRVEPVRSGERWASFFWVQSMVREAERRALLFDLDRAIAAARRRPGRRPRSRRLAGRQLPQPHPDVGGDVSNPAAFLKAALMRVCHPAPPALNAARTSGSRRTVVDTLLAESLGLPRRT